MKTMGLVRISVSHLMVSIFACLWTSMACGQGDAARFSGRGTAEGLEGVQGTGAVFEEELEEPDGDFFHENLDAFGNWFEVSGYGRCWRPTGLPETWRPYSEGYWAYTDAGWTWVSYEPFGSIVHHYGRWIRLMDIGWVWVPGREWGPAWVSWRYGDEYVGWAPLPPAARWRSEIGISTWVDVSAGIGPGSYQFCSVRDFGAPVLSRVILSGSRNSLFVQITQNVTNITYHNLRPFCGGPRYDWLSARCERPVPRLRLVYEERVDRIRSRAYLEGRRDGFSEGLVAGRVGDVLVMPAPKSVKVESDAARGVAAVRQMPTSGVDAGWRGVSDRDRRQVESAMARDVAGLTPAIAPARKPGIEELRSAPKPVGIVEKKELLSKGGLKPVSDFRPSISREDRDPAPVAGNGMGRPKLPESFNRQKTEAPRDDEASLMRRDSDAFAESRRIQAGNAIKSQGGNLMGTATNQAVTKPPATTGPVPLDPQNLGPAGIVATDQKTTNASSTIATSPKMASPTRGAIAGQREQDRKAEEMRRQSDQFARERSFASPNGANPRTPFGLPRTNASPGFQSESIGAKSVGASDPTRPSQNIFDRQRLEQQRMAADQVNREKSVRMQSPFAGNPVQRSNASSLQTQSLPANVRPPQSQGPPPSVGMPPQRGVPTLPAASSAKKKDEEAKR